MAVPTRYIAQRLSVRQGGRFTRAVGRLAQVSAALGAALMVCAFCILQGFRVEVRERIFSFGGHALVQKITAVRDQADWVNGHGKLYQLAESGNLAGVRHVQGFIYKPVLARAPKQAEGLLLKGLDPRFDSAAFRQNLVAGCLPGQAKTDSVTLPLCLSTKLASRLQLGIDSVTLLYFLQEPPKIRKGRVCGLYKTGLEEYDETIALTTAGHLQALAGVGDSMFNGMEVFATDYSHIDEMLVSVRSVLPFDQQAIPATELQVQIFDWLDVIGRNVQVMLVLICLVACMNTAGTLLIFLLEKMRTMGLLVALGATPRTLRRIFWLMGLRLAGVGILWGNAVGIALCLLQEYTHVIPLDQDSYYVDHVPIAWNFLNLLYMNLALIGSLAIVLWLPAWRAGQISPVEAMKES